MREIVAIVACAFLLTTIFSSGINGSDINKEVHFYYDSNPAPLRKSAYSKLPIGSIKANGWLEYQLQLQSDGLTGHLEELHVDVGPNSDWLGGSVDSWESAPYYVRGLTDLAYQTGNKTLIERAQKWIDWTISSQREDGFFGPVSRDKDRAKDQYWWPRMPMLHALRIYCDATGDGRVIDFMTRYFEYQFENLPKDPNGMGDWGYYRGGENLASVYWLYSKTGELWLLDLAGMIFEKTYDWTALFSTDAPITGSRISPDQSHAVNVAMAYKLPALYWLQSSDERYLNAVYSGIEHTSKYHGQIQGSLAGGESLRSTSGTAGSELCEVVEEMYSMETILGITGDPMFADRIERLAFNALPAALTPGITGHQYFQQPNQIECGYMPTTSFFPPYPDALQFGAFPAYKCCGMNMHFGWPSLCEHLWMASSDGAMAAMVYAPCEVSAVADDGTRVRILEETDYPFRNSVKLVINPERAADFSLQLRIPGWCNRASYLISDSSGAFVGSGSDLRPSTFVTVEREWKPGDTVSLELPREIAVSRWEKGSVGVEYGPLVFSVAIEERWVPDRDTRTHPIAKLVRSALFPGVNYTDERFGPWQVQPQSDWNYGVVAPDDNIASAFELVDSGEEVGLQPWAPDTVPITARMTGRKIQSWKKSITQEAKPIPQSPVVSGEPDEEIILKPYGSVRLRISYIPLIRNDLS